MRKLLLLLISILALPSVFSLITFSPTSLNLCGSYSQFATVTANITNQNNFTLQNIAAAFYITGNPGLSFMTPQSLNLGSLNESRSVLATYTIQCSSPNQNVYTGYFNLTATGYKESSKPSVLAITVHSSSSFTGNMTISQTPVTEQSPAFIGDNTPTINVNTNRNAVCRGSLDSDEAYSSMDFIFYGSARSHEYTFLDIISNGIHKVYVKCQDEYGFIMSNSMIISFIIDTSSPQIVLENPKSAVIGDYVDFKVSINEEGECRYGKADEPFDSL
ncbi:MAG: hypothetical protein NDI94_07085, partial [Candidatus Woesearchaeota archaeon]|nr:hypothetical protein [Candidatus Woesearchaeota archaeon]